jgi:hypothetical protein
LTIEAATKFVPLIASVKAALPATVLFGEIVVIVGVGLDPLDVGRLIDDGLVPPPHPARSKRLTFQLPTSTSPTVGEMHNRFKWRSAHPT